MSVFNMGSLFAINNWIRMEIYFIIYDWIVFKIVIDCKHNWWILLNNADF